MKRRLPDSPHIPSGVVVKLVTSGVGDKGKDKVGEVSASGPVEEDVFEEPADDEEDEVPLAVKQSVVKEVAVERTKKRAARSPSKPRASKKAAQVKIAAQVRQLALPIQEEVQEVFLAWLLYLIIAVFVFFV